MKKTKKRLLSLMLGLTAICTVFGLTACDSGSGGKGNMFGHNYDKEVVTDKYLKSKATCTQKAVYYISCECGAVGEETFEYGETVPHEYHGVVTKPTCTEQGYTTYTCDCGESYVSDYVNAKGHTYTTSVTNPTCTEQGYTTYTCDCGESYVSDYVNAKGHTEVVDTAVEPTCTQTGLTAGKHCSVCKEVLVAQTVINKKDHTYTTVVTNPTCTEQGYTTYTCDCGDSYVSDYVNANGHTTVNGVCTVCGEGKTEQTPSVGLTYTLSSNGNSYSVTGIGTCQDASLVIPATYNNLPVTTIECYAFEDCTSLTSVIIPDSVTTIEYRAFEYCDNLTSVIIPDSVTTIERYAFYSCDSLTSIEVAEDNTAYKDIDGNLYSKDGTTLIQYAIGKTATSFTIPDSVTTIGSSAFLDCDNLTNIVIPDSVTAIGSYAFYYCTSLQDIQFTGTVEEWNAILKGSNWNYTESSVTKVVCLDGEVAI